MSNTFNVGDIVRIGKGKVEYEVTTPEAAGTVDLKSLNSGKTSGAVEVSRLTLVPHASVEAIEDAIAQGAQDTNVTVTLDVGDEALQVWEAELLAPQGDGEFLLTLDGVVTRERTFDTAAFKLSRAKGVYSKASIDRNGHRLVSRSA